MTRLYNYTLRLVITRLVITGLVSCFIVSNIASADNSPKLAALDSLTIDKLDNYLANQEAPYHDIVDGTHKHIRWAAGVKKTPIAFVYLHGFSASNQEINPVTDLLGDHFTANIYYSRLKGHARSDDAMAEATMQDWLTETMQAYKIAQKIGEKVIIISTSTGGTLATWLAAQGYASDIAANIMLSPNFGIKDRLGEIVRWSWGLQFAKWLKGPYYSFEPSNELHDKYWTQRYPVEAIVPMIRLVDKVVAMDKTNIQCPQLILYSPNDQVISVDRVISVSEQFTNAVVRLEPFTQSKDHSQHVLAGAATSPDSVASVVSLISAYIKQL